jgi:hypothetical protein
LRLEDADEAQKQPLHSYLLVPNQRVMRMPLLMEAVLKRFRAARPARVETNEYAIVKRCFETLQKVRDDVSAVMLWFSVWITPDTQIIIF